MFSPCWDLKFLVIFWKVWDSWYACCTGGSFTSTLLGNKLKIILTFILAEVDELIHGWFSYNSHPSQLFLHATIVSLQWVVCSY